MNSLISNLINDGQTLVSLLREAKRKSKLSNTNERSDDNCEVVKNTIEKLLEKFDSPQGTISVDFDTISANNVLRKIEETLQKFIQLDDKQASIYEELKKKVDKMRRTKFSIKTSSSLNQTNKTTIDYASDFSPLQDDSDFEDAYANLNCKELQCLFCLFFVTSANNNEFKKRELIYWWIGMELIENDMEGYQVLSKLLDEGFINRVIGNMTIYNRYKMQQCVMSKLEPKMRMVGFLWPYHRKLENDETFSIIHDQHGHDNINHVEPDNIVALHNIKRPNHNARALEAISRMKNIKMLSLGISESSSSNDRTIEIDRVKNLKSALGRLRKVRCLSLRGISRIVELPNTVYKLKNLRVLDLKACHDLMIIPRGIESLYNLTHLDLSMCYMLDDIPYEIGLLRNIVVLKGFLINEYEVLPPYALDALSLSGSLRKLSIRTKRMNFPTKDDCATLERMSQLETLNIVWVGRPDISREDKDYSNVNFPPKVTKVVLEAAPATMASILLELVSKQVRVEKLHIKGGRLWDFGPRRDVQFVHIKFLRLRYLPNLHINWSDFKTLFPNLRRLEVFKCPNLMFFPCDQNGVWESLE